MAKEPAAELADRLFTSFVAPMVLGGAMDLGRPIGSARAFTLTSDHRATDDATWTTVGMARVRVARTLSPLDSQSELGAVEWAMAAALHDLVQSTHPALAQRFGGRRARELVGLSTKTLLRLPYAAHTGEALARHTLFSRILQIARTHTKVSWWTGSATFVGVEPPARLTAWPEARRVQIDRDPRRLERLVEPGSAHRAALEAALQLFLLHTPLTDWATLSRTWPAFQFTEQNLGLAQTHAGRSLVLRLLRPAAPAALDEVLGRALGPFLRPSGASAFRAVLDLLGERTLEEALFAVHEPEAGHARRVSSEGAAALAQTAGALAARELVALRGDAFSELERRAVLHRLAPLARGAVADQLQALWPAPRAA